MHQLGEWPAEAMREQLLTLLRRRVGRSAIQYTVAVALLLAAAVLEPVVLGVALFVVVLALFRPAMAWVRYRRLRAATLATRARATGLVRGEWLSKTAELAVTVEGRTRSLRGVGLFGQPAALDGDVVLVSDRRGRPVAVVSSDRARVVFVSA